MPIEPGQVLYLVETASDFDGARTDLSLCAWLDAGLESIQAKLNKMRGLGSRVEVDVAVVETGKGVASDIDFYVDDCWMAGIYPLELDVDSRATLGALRDAAELSGEKLQVALTQILNA